MIMSQSPKSRVNDSNFKYKTQITIHGILSQSPKSRVNDSNLNEKIIINNMNYNVAIP